MELIEYSLAIIIGHFRINCGVSALISLADAKQCGLNILLHSLSAAQFINQLRLNRHQTFNSFLSLCNILYYFIILLLHFCFSFLFSFCNSLELVVLSYSFPLFDFLSKAIIFDLLGHSDLKELLLSLFFDFLFDLLIIFLCHFLLY